MSARFLYPGGWHPEAIERQKLSFEYEALLSVFRTEIDAIFSLERAPTTPLGHRHRYSAAMATIVRMFDALSFGPLATMQFVALAEALDELDYGILRPFLKPNEAGQKRADDGGLWVARAWLCIAVEYGKQGGLSRRAAAIETGKQVPHIAVALKGDPANFGRSIENWHRLFASQKIKSANALSMFEKRDWLFEEWRSRLTDSDPATIRAKCIASALNQALIGATLIADLPGFTPIAARLKVRTKG